MSNLYLVECTGSRPIRKRIVAADAKQAADNVRPTLTPGQRIQAVYALIYDGDPRTAEEAS